MRFTYTSSTLSLAFGSAHLVSTARCSTSGTLIALWAKNSLECPSYASASGFGSSRNAMRASSSAAASVCLALAGGGAMTEASCSGSGSTDAPSADSKCDKKKSIDIFAPLHPPEHNTGLPFPESSIRHDTYEGVTLDVAKLDPGVIADPDQFGRDLATALQVWKLEKRRGIWIRLQTIHSALIPAIAHLGFDFQHAEPGQVVLTRWLPIDAESRLPNGPTHQVGIGAVVLHPITGKMLAVREKSGPAAAQGLWKMPTGLTDPGEDVATAAVRELSEETGLDCVFDRIVCFRETHGGLFGRSDLFFVCLCRLAPSLEDAARAGGTVELSPQEEEIAQVDWIELEDYADQDLWKESPLYQELNGALILAARYGIEDGGNAQANNSLTAGGGGFVGKTLPLGYRPGSNTIYVSKL